MNTKTAVVGLIALAGLVAFGVSGARPKVRRVGMVILVKPERIAEYKALHADSNPGVRKLLRKYHLRNFSIYMRQLDDGKHYLFGYYEYNGTDFEADMAKLKTEPRNKEWNSVTRSMQIPLKGEKSWAVMEEVYHDD